MNVGIVGPCTNSVSQLVRAIAARGHRVSVISLSPEVTECKVTTTDPSVTYYVYPRRANKQMRDLYRLERQGITEAIRLANPDVLHAQWTYEFALACLQSNLPTLITSRDDACEILRFHKDLYRLGRLYLQIRVLRQAPFVVAVSPYLANSLQWLVKSNIEVIPNFIEVPKESAPLYQRSMHPVRIATVLNGWGNRKNPKTAIRAFGILRQNLPDAELYMYGVDYEVEGAASQWASKAGLHQNIRFCGFLPTEDLQRELGKMSILLHPSLEESFGMVVIEAMASGLPVVAGIDAGAVPWVLDDGRAGFLTDVRKPGKIAEAVLSCIRQSEDRQNRQMRAYDRVSSLFSPEAAAVQYEKLYEKVIDFYRSHYQGRTGRVNGKSRDGQSSNKEGGDTVTW